MTASYFPPFAKAKDSFAYGFYSRRAFSPRGGENYRLRKVFLSLSLRASATERYEIFNSSIFPTARNCSILSTNHRPFYLSFTIPCHSAPRSFEERVPFCRKQFRNGLPQHVSLRAAVFQSRARFIRTCDTPWEFSNGSGVRPLTGPNRIRQSPVLIGKQKLDKSKRFCQSSVISWNFTDCSNVIELSRKQRHQPVHLSFRALLRKFRA